MPDEKILSCNYELINYFTIMGLSLYLILIVAVPLISFHQRCL
ncbi:hypothetical protein CIT292_09681 [Citrobacter youngae ATCC 29220]|uniref:Uncharacterized protein n=1 Tax=Citrobacter youngae ATCC 29220 TaxID=500640 RepID=D4BGN1_9ENTR|nr:hypothetical protein CIT292_09681 [Citrobacter youngae ATCC 29220]